MNQSELDKKYMQLVKNQSHCKITSFQHTTQHGCKAYDIVLCKDVAEERQIFPELLRYIRDTRDCPKVAYTIGGLLTILHRNTSCWKNTQGKVCTIFLQNLKTV